MKLWNWTKGLTKEELEKYEYGFRALRPEPTTECMILFLFALIVAVEIIEVL